jgi:hypothetical protein
MARGSLPRSRAGRLLSVWRPSRHPRFDRASCLCNIARPG